MRHCLALVAPGLVAVSKQEMRCSPKIGCQIAEVWSWGRNKAGQLGVGDYRRGCGHLGTLEKPMCKSLVVIGRDRTQPVKVCHDLVF